MASEGRKRESESNDGERQQRWESEASYLHSDDGGDGVKDSEGAILSAFCSIPVTCEEMCDLMQMSGWLSLHGFFFFCVYVVVVGSVTYSV